MRYYIFVIAILAQFASIQYTRGQSNQGKALYNKAFTDIKDALHSNVAISFKTACFVTENTYFDDRLDFFKFNAAIQNLKDMALAWMKANPLIGYHYSDSNNFHRNFAIYKVLMDTIRFMQNDSAVFGHLPFSYDFDDFAGDVHWENMFVTKLLASRKGNCHSLPFLYKILADELNASCWLALAPNHMYISNRCKKIGWYNTELTSGVFPVDAWIMASGYLPTQAIQSGIYMDTLSDQQSVALCILDLAKGYEHKFRNYTDGYIIKCCDLSLQLFPLNVQAILLKAETLKHIYESQKATGNSNARKTFVAMQALYLKLFDLGYREMPNKMYVQWLGSVVKERDKYGNPRIKAAAVGQ